MYDRNHPFNATVKERYSLCKPGSKKFTHHVVLDLKGSGIQYHVGDSVAIYPTHDPELVQRTLQALGAKGDEIVHDKHTQQPYSLREFLTSKASITDVSRKMVQEMANRQTDAAKKERLNFLFAEGNKDALKEYQKNHELWDALEENREVVWSPTELPQFIQPMLPRFYSIASSQKAVGEEVHLTVSYVKFVSNQYPRLGVCSHFLCDMAQMHKTAIPLYVQPSNGFILPQDPKTDIILIGPGTGVAPFRAFLQERIETGATGRNWLFFGEWNSAYDYFYQDFWESLEKEDQIRVDTAFSRDQPHKVYVQHRMMENASEFWEWLKNGAVAYVCGDAHRMAKDVDATLHQIVQEQGRMDDTAAKAFVKQLRADKRYLRDVY